MHIYPALVCKLCHGHSGWIVGSGAKPDADPTNLRDWDVLIPFRHWNQAMLLIPNDAIPNTFGGWKCSSEGKEVDVWPGDLDALMLNEKALYAYHLQSGTRLFKE